MMSERRSSDSLDFPWTRYRAAERFLKTIKPWWSPYIGRINPIPIDIGTPTGDGGYDAATSMDEGFNLFVDRNFAVTAPLHILAGGIEHGIQRHARNTWRRLDWLTRDEWNQWASIAFDLEINSSIEAEFGFLEERNILAICSRSSVFTDKECERWSVNLPPSLGDTGWQPEALGLPPKLSAEEYYRLLTQPPENPPEEEPEETDPEDEEEEEPEEEDSESDDEGSGSDSNGEQDSQEEDQEEPDSEEEGQSKDSQEQDSQEQDSQDKGGSESSESEPGDEQSDSPDGEQDSPDTEDDPDSQGQAENGAETSGEDGDESPDSEDAQGGDSDSSPEDDDESQNGEQETPSGSESSDQDNQEEAEGDEGQPSGGESSNGEDGDGQEGDSQDPSGDQGGDSEQEANEGSSTQETDSSPGSGKSPAEMVEELKETSPSHAWWSQECPHHSDREDRAWEQENAEKMNDPAEIDEEELQDELIEAMDENARFGLSPGESLIEIRKTREKVLGVDVESVFHRLLTRMIGNVKIRGASDLSYSVRNPNQPQLGPVYMGMHDYSPTIYILQDVSGSMIWGQSMERCISLFEKLTASVLRRYGDSVTWITADAGVQQIGRANRVDKHVRKAYSYGGGGTVFSDVMDDISQGQLRHDGKRYKQPDILIILTDCGFEWPWREKQPKMPVLVCSTKPHERIAKRLPFWFEEGKNFMHFYAE